MLYSEEVLSGKGIELEDRREASNIRFPQGVSIYKKELEKRMRSLERQDQKQIKTIQEEVKTVRFYSIWDRELNSLLSKYKREMKSKKSMSLQKQYRNGRKRYKNDIKISSVE